MISEVDRLQVDIYWPHDGAYGYPSIVGDLEEEAHMVAKLRHRGYGSPSSHTPSVIQVRRVRTGSEDVIHEEKQR